jgi:hypothetical protein
VPVLGGHFKLKSPCRGDNAIPHSLVNEVEEQTSHHLVVTNHPVTVTPSIVIEARLMEW